MLRKINKQESILIKDDPVRPGFSYEWRTSLGREVWVWEQAGTVEAVICVAYTNDVPTSEEELDLFSSLAAFNDQRGNTAVFYTVWSYAQGAGRTIVNELAAHLQKTRPHITRWVTLSPLTEMARNFHLRNGAKLLQVNDTTQNFDYTERVRELTDSNLHSDLST